MRHTDTDSGTRGRQISIVLPADVYEAARRAATREARTVSNFAVLAVRRELAIRGDLPESER